MVVIPIEIYSCDEIERRQEGYRFHRSGISLINSHGWREGWIVIGQDALIDDPIFVDMQSTGLPVSTAAHGEESWDAVLVAQSARVFFEALTIANAQQQGLLDTQSALARIVELNQHQDFDIEFWAVFLEG